MARVLVADDDPDIRRLVVMKLRSAGHAVTEVGDGNAAVEVARAEAPDLLLLDLMMPGMSGTEVCQTLRAEDRFADVPMVLLTARAQERDVTSGLAAGATAYLSKPFSPRGLIEELAPYLGDPDR
ncbi:response regulator [Nitriliruptor alkaliphilus]|uniref:response regulator n=1 Tax=Nitriliruptor alkaliphilus TaxID=427918 RepID=UPI00069879EE|nr:response regulator [Nitriliruptor alkaliphilus]